MDFDRGMSWCLAASIVAAIGIGGAAKGQQIDALFRTNLPTYTTNNTPSTLIVDVNGRLRVAAEGPAGAAILVAPAAGAEVQGTTEDGVAPVGTADKPVLIGGVDPATGLAQTVQTDSLGGLAITTSAAGAGAVAATTPRLTLASDDPAVASLGVMDDWDEANRAAVNAIAGQVGVQGGAGAATALTQRVTVATDDVVTVDGSAGAAIQQGAGAATAGTLRITQATDDAAAVALADDSIALEAGTATVGSIGAIVNALPAGGNNIGDVDVLTLPALVAGAANIGDVDVLTVNGVAPAFGAGAVGATVQRVTMSTDDVVTVDGSAGAAIQQGGGAATAATLRITQSTDDAGVTSLAALDDLVRGEDSAHASLDSGVMALAVHSDTAQTLAGANGDYAPAVLTRLGAHRTAAQPEAYIDSLGAYYLVATAFTTVTTAGAGEIQPVAAQGAGNSIVLLDWIVSTDTAVNVQFESDDSDAGITARVYLAANGGWTSDHAAAWGETADNQALKLQVSAAATVSVQVRYIVR